MAGYTVPHVPGRYRDPEGCIWQLHPSGRWQYVARVNHVGKLVDVKNSGMISFADLKAIHERTTSVFPLVLIDE